jgi:adenylate kinase
MYPNIHFFGIQGSGKDVQATHLATHFHLLHLSSGKLLRARASQGDELAARLHYQLEVGALIPDDILLDTVAMP